MKNIKKYSILFITVAALSCCTHVFGMDIFQAIRENNIGKAKELISDSSFNFKQVDEYGYTPLNFACNKNYLKNNLEMVKLLLGFDAKKYINQANNYGYTPLHHACLFDSLEVVKLLLEKACSELGESSAQESLNKANKHGETPLYLACDHGNLEMAKLLLEYGANVDDKSMQEAKNQNKSKILELLKSHTNTICSICGSKIENDQDVAILDCKEEHKFHKDCIEWWHLVRQTCPNCECSAKIKNTFIANKNVNLEEKVSTEISAKEDGIGLQDVEVKI